MTPIELKAALGFDPDDTKELLEQSIRAIADDHGTENYRIPISAPLFRTLPEYRTPCPYCGSLRDSRLADSGESAMTLLNYQTKRRKFYGRFFDGIQKQF